jgi:hypothetical protein
MWITVFSLAAVLALCFSGIAVLVEEPDRLRLSNSKHVAR